MPRSATTAQFAALPLQTVSAAAPFGYFCLGLTVFAYGLERLGALPAAFLGVLILAGALGQISAGLLQLKKDRPFTAVAFTAFGLFWLSLLGLTVLPDAGWGEPAQASAIVSYLGVWAAFCLILLLGAAGGGRAQQSVFGLLLAFLVFSGCSEIMAQPPLILAAGLSCLGVALASLYAGLSLLLASAAD